MKQDKTIYRYDHDFMIYGYGEECCSISHELREKLIKSQESYQEIDIICDYSIWELEHHIYEVVLEFTPRVHLTYIIPGVPLAGDILVPNKNYNCLTGIRRYINARYGQEYDVIHESLLLDYTERAVVERVEQLKTRSTKDQIWIALNDNKSTDEYQFKVYCREKQH